MKKLLAFLLLICCLISTFHFKSQTSPIFSLENIGKVCFVNEKSFDIENVENIESGNLFYNYCSLETAKKNLDLLQKNSKGVQLYCEKVDLDYVLKTLKAEIVSQNEIDNMKIVYCYTPFYDKAVFEDGKKINLQIAMKDEQVVLGFPLILTGF